MSKEKEDIVSKAKEYKKHLQICENQLYQAKEMNFCLIEMSKRFAQEKEFWQSMYYEIQNSTSWKITKPLRLLVGFLRRIK